MTAATILFNSLAWLPIAVVFFLAGLIILFWTYRQTQRTGPYRWICVLLKLIGIAALALCLLEPLWTSPRAKAGANYFVALADNSMSLVLKDQNSPQSRGEQLRQTLTDPAAQWPEVLAQDFQLRRYMFDTRLQRVESFGELNFEGKGSALQSSLKGLTERFQGQPLAGILLFTDGNATDLVQGAIPTNGLPPIYPIVVGGDSPSRDLSLQSVKVSQTAFEDAPVTVQADVVGYGFGGEKVTAKLKDLSGKVVAEQSEEAKGAESKLAFRFQFKPEKAGLSYYHVSVEGPASSQPSTSAPKSGSEGSTPKTISPTGATEVEATLANNSQTISVDRGQEPFRVLYVSGRPNWEYKFLNRALSDDDQVQLVGLIRIARREPKFDFRSRAGESSNPLFRGFDGVNKEEAVRYDQPVLIRLNTRDQNELRGGFPKTAEELFSYHALVIDDLEAAFFTQEQMQLIQKFVSQRGGGLLMLGGQESFIQGKYNRTLIGDLLPVYLDSTPSGPPATNGLRLQMTREGLLQPWARLRSQESDETARLKEMPGFQVLNRVRDFKPGATVVATIKDPQGNTYPGIIIQRFGNGRTAAVTLGDVWRWGLRDATLKKDMDKAWRQLVRWLVSDVPPRINLTSEPVPGDPNHAVTLQLRARDKEFQPLDNAAVSIVVRSAEAKGTNRSEVKITAEPSATEPGVYTATFIPREIGAYEAAAVVTTGAGVEEGKSATGWSSNPGSEEFQSLKPNRAFLESLARSTGGEVVPMSGLQAFVKSLPNRKMPITENVSSPLWHRSLVFAFALACIALEWGIRRWKGLA